MVHILVVISLDELIFMLKILFTFVMKHVTLMRRQTVLSLSRQLVFHEVPHFIFQSSPMEQHSI
jgi:hypothetical protein